MFHISSIRSKTKFIDIQLRDFKLCWWKALVPTKSQNFSIHICNCDKNWITYFNLQLSIANTIVLNWMVKYLLYGLLSAFVSLWTFSVFSQTTWQSKRFPKGAAFKLTHNDIINLKQSLNIEDWDSVRQLFFRATYDRDIPDIICYIKNYGDSVALPKNKTVSRTTIW